MRPVVDPAVIKREKDVLADKFKQQGKPDNVIDKIVENGLKTFYKEVRPARAGLYVHDPAKNVAQALKEAEGTVGGPIKITGFVRYGSVRESRSRKPTWRSRGRGR